MIWKTYQIGPKAEQRCLGMQHIHSSHVRTYNYTFGFPFNLANLIFTDMGQGGAMAIEDAVSLATMLPQGTKAGEITSRLRLYEAARRQRIGLVLDYTRQNGRDENDAAGGARISRKNLLLFFLHLSLPC